MVNVQVASTTTNTDKEINDACFQCSISTVWSANNIVMLDTIKSCVRAHLLLRQWRQYLKLIARQSLKPSDVQHRYVDHQLSHVLREALISSMYDDYPNFQ